MFVFNSSRFYIGPISFEGFNFLIPPGVSSIWDDAGKYFTTKLYRIEVKDPVQDGGAPLPPLVDYTEAVKQKPELWKGIYTNVTRFQVESKYIPNPNDVFRLAEKRGVPKEDIARFRNQEDFDTLELLKIMNALPVPEEIMYPDKLPEKNKKPE